jgi:hypothetical protein
LEGCTTSRPFQYQFIEVGALVYQVGRAGFEPTKAEPTDLQSAPFDRFGISPTISYLKNSQNIQSLNQTPDFKGMQNYTLFSFIQTNASNCIFFLLRVRKPDLERVFGPSNGCTAVSK